MLLSRANAQSPIPCPCRPVDLARVPPTPRVIADRDDRIGKRADASSTRASAGGPEEVPLGLGWCQVGRPPVGGVRLGAAPIRRIAVLSSSDPRNQVEDRDPRQWATAGRAFSRLVHWPHGFAVHQVDTCGPQGGEVTGPGGMSDVCGAHSREDDHRNRGVTDGLVRGRECLIVRNPERELCDRVGRRRSHHAAGEFRMWTRLVGKPRAITERKTGGLLHANPLLALRQPLARRRRQGDGDLPVSPQRRFHEAVPDGA
jgi:hypothetical protein